MIERDAVLATQNGFVTIDKINSSQWVRAHGQKLTLLEKVDDAETYAVLIETKHFSIICSHNQKFIVNETQFMEAYNLAPSEQVLTSEGFQPVLNVVRLDGGHKMSNIITKAKIFQANGFVLLTD